MSCAMPVKHETRKKRCRTPKYEASLDLPPPVKKLMEDCSNLAAQGEHLNSFIKSSWDDSVFENHQTEDKFLNQSDCSIQSYRGSVAHLGDAIHQDSSNFLEQSPHILTSVKDTFSDIELSAAERPNKRVKCNVTSGWEDMPLKIDSEMKDILVSSNLSADCVDFSDIAYVSQDRVKPFLRSCLSRRSLLLDDSSFESDERFVSRTGNLRVKKKWDGDNERDQVFGATSLVDERIPFVWSSPRSKTQHFRKKNPDTFLEDQTISLSSASGELDDEGARCQVDSFIDGDKDGHPLEFDDDPMSEYFADRPVDDCILGQNNVGGLSQETCSFSRLYAVKSPAGNSGEIIGSQDLYRGDDKFSSFFHRYTDETEWLWSESSAKETLINCSQMHDTSSDGGDGELYGSIHVMYQGKQFDCKKREKRSRSAPPFYRGRKKLFALDTSFISALGNPKLLIIDDAPISPGTCLKHLQHCSRTNSPIHAPQTSSQSHFSSIRNTVDRIPDGKTSPDDVVVQKSILLVHGTNSCSLDLGEGSRSRRDEDLLNSGSKCRETFLSSASCNWSLESRTEDIILDISSFIFHLSGDSLIPNSIDKNCLEHARVLQQVDKKFIPIVAGRTLAIIDQHAADERIRLEELRQKVLSGESKTITYLDAEQELVLPEIGYQLLYNYAEQIRSWGWICNIHARDSKSFMKNLKVLHRRPTVTRLLAVPCILGVNLTDVDLLEYLQQLADTDGSSTIPPAVHRVLNNKSCRGAIMFGDTLLPSECSLIVEELKQTSLCFQCAHGRPTTVPLVNLDVLHKQIAKLRLSNNGSCTSWHGFYRHRISMERAAERLG